MLKRQQKVSGYILFIFTSLLNCFFFGYLSIQTYNTAFLSITTGYLTFCNTLGLISGLKEDESLLRIYKFFIYKLAIIYGIIVAIFTFGVLQGIYMNKDSLNITICSIILILFIIQLLVALQHIRVVNSMLIQFNQPQLLLQAYQNQSFNQLPVHEINNRPVLVQQQGYPVYANQQYQAYPVNSNIHVVHPYQNQNHYLPIVQQKNYQYPQQFAQ